MRPKELRIVVTFETTTAAMAFESEAKKRQIGGRLIPVPREITAGCGTELFSTDRRERTDLQSDTADAVPEGAGTGNIKRREAVQV